MHLNDVYDKWCMDGERYDDVIELLERMLISSNIIPAAPIQKNIVYNVHNFCWFPIDKCILAQFTCFSKGQMATSILLYLFWLVTSSVFDKTDLLGLFSTNQNFKHLETLQFLIMVLGPTTHFTIRKKFQK